ncbi:MAG: DUF4124 domain-containing protein [Xanthomonadales bacterium]|nr:DUF4124 domain-containing protein [Xanthomonadales bacterium]MCB1633252.1 DUF4124 domain-containing protein [Xanthomonadales bacterium]MCB1642907.1 DUF4124 domain-containing protein [Xanthomonadales bacterium]
MILRNLVPAAVLSVSALLILWMPAAAQAAVYKCVGANGQLTYSQSPCVGEQRQEVLQPDRPLAAQAGGPESRYRDWQELTERFACDDVDTAMAVLPNRLSMISLMADLARQPGRSARWIQDQADADPALLQDGYLFRGALCTVRLVEQPGELALGLGWYSAAPRQFGSWPERRLLAALRELGYDEVHAAAADHESEMRFQGAGFDCHLRVHRSSTDASLDLECVRGGVEP